MITYIESSLWCAHFEAVKVNNMWARTGINVLDLVGTICQLL